MLSMEENMIISNAKYPPGIRFHPSDQELITYYLKRKVNSLSLPADIIADIELYNYNPWDLPRKAWFGDDEWYFFTPRDRKYPNGGRPNRTAVSGYWKATGKDKPVFDSSGSRTIGVKKALVFYKGKPANSVKMDWIMTEYRLLDTSRPLIRSKGSMRLDDWVLCRVRQKGNMSKKKTEDDRNSWDFQEEHHMTEEVPSVHTDRSRDIFGDCQESSEFHLIASLLNGHDPGNESLLRTTFQTDDTENSSETVHEHGLGNIDTQATFSLFQNYSNGQQRGNNLDPNYSTNAYVDFQELDMPGMGDNFLQ